MNFRKRFFAWMLKNGDTLNQKIYAPYKKDLFSDLKGTIVEIGPGAGGNLDYLPNGTEWIGIEPNDAFHKSLLHRANEKGINAKLLSPDAAHISLSNNSIDVILCTLVLCSVSQPVEVIAEMKRILKPGGKLIFIEHVAASKNSFLRSAQNVFNPFNKIIADGCNCNRETWKDIQKAGFSRVELSHTRVNGGLILHSPHIMGYAVK